MSFILSEEHLEAVARKRKVVVNFDVLVVDPAIDEDPNALACERLTYADYPDITIDSIWWNWSEGNIVTYPSKRIPSFIHPGYERWVNDGIDIVKVFLDETHERGIESFYAHRINGGDGDPMFLPEVGLIHDGVVKAGKKPPGPWGTYTIPMKEKHPEWLFYSSQSQIGYWNFAIEEVREFILGNLQEIAERYDFDGIDLDFARGAIFPQGEGWINRDSMTTFMRDLRKILLDIEKSRGQPFLLSARVPHDIVGCHFDGIDVERWAEENLVDIFVLGCRSFEVDLLSFKNFTDDTHIKLYAALDDHHSTDSYCTPPIEVFRGVFSNWYRQGADGVQTFNWAHGPYNHMADPGQNWDLTIGTAWAKMHGQAYSELSNPDSTKLLDKTFVVQRRGGGHGNEWVPDPETWYTPRRNYHNANMFSQLPLEIPVNPDVDGLINLYVGDDVNAQSNQIQSIDLKILLHDAGNGDYIHVPRADTPPVAGNNTIDRVIIRDWGIPEREGKDNPIQLHNNPPQKSIEEGIKVHINNIPVDTPSVESGWLVCKISPLTLATGENLVGISHNNIANYTSKLVIEKLELHVKYINI